MKLPRRSRLIAVCLMLVSMLAMQLTFAACRCGEDLTARHHGMPAAHGTDMTHCTRHAPRQHDTCPNHVQVDKKALDKAEFAKIPEAAAVQPIIAFLPPPALPANRSLPVDTDWHLSINVPPLCIQHCTFQL